MLSHDLARELLARRNNDVRIEILVDDDPAEVRDVYATRIELRDSGASRGSTYELPPEEIVTYLADDDVIVIRAGLLVIGGPDL